jgi:hypothetical protein
MNVDKFYFYEMYREFVIEFNTLKEAEEWVKIGRQKDKYFGYDGYWIKDGESARKCFNLDGKGRI